MNVQTAARTPLFAVLASVALVGCSWVDGVYQKAWVSPAEKQGSRTNSPATVDESDRVSAALEELDIRIRDLERRMRDLRRTDASTSGLDSRQQASPSVISTLDARIRALEGRLALAPERTPRIGPQAGAEPQNAWRRLFVGQRREDVATMFGAGYSVTRSGPLEVWSFAKGGQISFMDDKVSGWHEPLR